jgi:hypothetical protein
MALDPRISSSALAGALLTAIKVREEKEKLEGFTGPSGLLWQWKSALDTLRAGDRLEIRYED